MLTFESIMYLPAKGKALNINPLYRYTVMFILSEVHFGEQTIKAVAGNKKALLAQLNHLIAGIEAVEDFSEDYEPMTVLVLGEWYTSLDYNTLLKWDSKQSMTMSMWWQGKSDSSIEWLITCIPDNMKNTHVF